MSNMAERYHRVAGFASSGGYRSGTGMRSALSAAA